MQEEDNLHTDNLQFSNMRAIKIPENCISLKAGTLKLDLRVLKFRNPFFSLNTFLHITELLKL